MQLGGRVCGLAERRDGMQLEGRWGGMWNVVVWCAHVAVAVVAHGLGLAGIPWATLLCKIGPARSNMAGRLRCLTIGWTVVLLLHVSCGWC